MKKISILCILITLFALALCFTGCSKKEETSRHIVIWHDKEEQAIDVLRESFKKFEPEITVEFIRKEGLTEALKLAGNDPKASPDMFIFAHDKTGFLAELGIIEPLENIVSKDKMSDYLDLTVKAGTYKEKQYQLPLYFETLLFMYNRKFMSDKDAPSTTDELLDYMKAHTSNNHYGFVEQHSTAYYSAAWIHAFGGTLLDSNGKPGLNSAETKKALAYHKEFINYMPREAEYNTINTLFLTEMADSIIGGPWLVPSINEKNIDLGFAPMPVVNRTNKALAPYLGVQGIYVLKFAAKDAKKLEAVKKLMDALTAPEVGIKLAKITGCAPASRAAYDKDEIKNDQMVMAMKTTAEKAEPMPNLPEMDVLWTAAENLLSNVNIKNAPVESAADDAQAQAEKLIAQMK